MNYPYIPHTEEDIESMLDSLGFKSLDDLFVEVPKTISIDELDLPESMDGYSVMKRIEDLASKNVSMKILKVFAGAGIYNHYVPPIVDYLASKAGFVTAYTPYQAEVSQGTLQALFEYQTMICELTGMEVSNASMYDGASSLAEAALMAVRITGRDRILLAKSIHPEYRKTTKTYVEAQGIEIVEIDYDTKTGGLDIEDLKSKMDSNVAGVAVQYPNFFGVVEDLKVIKESLPENVIFIVTANPIALGLLEAPGKFGADIVVGEGQVLGNHPSFGGPGFGFFATRMKYIRKMPGRIIGQTKDVDGKTGYVMILQTREQHIRRAKATSNICSNHAHSAVRAAIYMSVMGKEGIHEVAKRSAISAHCLAKKLKEKGMKLRFSGPFFNEFVFEVGEGYENRWRRMIERGILGPLLMGRFYKELEGYALAATTELTTLKDIEALLEVIS